VDLLEATLLNDSVLARKLAERGLTLDLLGRGAR